ANGWRIRGLHQDIGRSDAQKGKTELVFPDSNEEWWIMPTFYSRRVESSVLGGRDVFIEGYVYIENTGGGGPLGNGDPESFIPLRYGCTANDNLASGGRLCSENPVGVRSKLMYQQLYGTVLNREDPFDSTPHTGKSMLRIYGDVLYPTAVAYGAGLIQRFFDEVTVQPTAAPGGPYSGEVCKPLTLDGSASSDPDGQLASFEWDLGDDGTVDSTEAVHRYTPTVPFNGSVRLRVVDDQGNDSEATTSMVVTRDVT